MAGVRAALIRSLHGVPTGGILSVRATSQSDSFSALCNPAAAIRAVSKSTTQTTVPSASAPNRPLPKVRDPEKIHSSDLGVFFVSTSTSHSLAGTMCVFPSAWYSTRRLSLAPAGGCQTFFSASYRIGFPDSRPISPIA